MRVRSYAVGIAALCAAGLAVPAMAADPDGGVTQQDVADARAAVDRTASDVDAVRATLAGAQQRLEAAQVAAARASEAFNGARYESDQAAQASAEARQRADAAAADLERQRAAYAGAMVSAYQMSPQLGALGAIAEAEGISEVVESASALGNAQAGLQERYDAYHAADALAEDAEARAEEALADAQAATVRARETRDEAQAAADTAAAEADRYAVERDRLIARLARLQDISVTLAEQREDQLAADAAAAAAAAAEQEAEQEAEEAEEQPTPPPVPTPTAAPTPTAPPTPAPSATPTAPPTTSSPTPTAPPTTPPTTPPPPPPPPPSSGSAAAAIAFARDQLGEPYAYGASGPDRWDCSGLTMQAWAAGGKSLPHYSVAQYQQSTPISLAELQPGDLLFWSDGGPSSIYHVALYTGGGKMIHAPRPGRGVEEVSIYYWITPTYFARP